MGKWTKLVDIVDSVKPPLRLNGYSSGEEEELQGFSYDENGELKGSPPKDAQYHDFSKKDGKWKREVFRTLISYQFEPESKEETEMGLEGVFIRANVHGMILYLKYAHPSLADKDDDYIMTNSSQAVLYKAHPDYDPRREYKLGDKLLSSPIVEGSKLKPSCGTNGYCIHTSEEFSDSMDTLTLLGRAPAELALRMKDFMVAIEQAENEEIEENNSSESEHPDEEPVRQVNRRLVKEVAELKGQVTKLQLQLSQLTHNANPEQANARRSPSSGHSPRLFRGEPAGQQDKENVHQRSRSNSFSV